MLNGVDAQTIDCRFQLEQALKRYRGNNHTGVVRHQALDPVVEKRPNLRIGGVHVGQCRRSIGQPALFDFFLVVVVLNETERVEVILAVQRIEDRVIHLAMRTAVALNAKC